MTMITVYEKIAVEMKGNGWEERASIVSDEYTKVVWKRKGDIGEWQFAVENKEEYRPDEVLCVLVFIIGKKFAAKLYTTKNVMNGAGVIPVLNALRKGIERLVQKETKGGYICQNL